ncbi:hypothetical protein RND71_010120 [Anisodus tanguticus]|uniref:RNA polymerase Rpb4/RPC9 core domain-containing protein n=1 Tax=Anisodus tanguticus TaxID=243964 RepID=A0AAE1VSF1_9SOLA|nr:hypothetical protein RND71_010120 [Anisodus tanguticus]
MSGEEEENAAELKIGDGNRDYCLGMKWKGIRLVVLHSSFSLREFLKAKCLMNCEVALILEHKYEQLQQMSDDPTNQISQVFEKSLQYVKRFSRYKNPDAVRQAREYPLAEFEASICAFNFLIYFMLVPLLVSSWEPQFISLNIVQLCVLGNLCPETVEEGVAMVPSIKNRGRALDEEAIEKMLTDLSLIKKFE